METNEKLTFTVPELAKLLGIGRNLAYDIVRRGDVRVVRLGKRLIVPRVEIQRILGDPTALVAIPLSSEGNANGRC